MKKILLTAVLVGLMSTSVMAAWWVPGKISLIRQDSGSAGQIWIKFASDTHNGTEFWKPICADNTKQKEILTLALTAAASNTPVYIDFSTCWNGLTLKYSTP